MKDRTVRGLERRCKALRKQKASYKKLLEEFLGAYSYVQMVAIQDKVQLLISKEVPDHEV